MYDDLKGNGEMLQVRNSSGVLGGNVKFEIVHTDNSNVKIQNNRLVATGEEKVTRLIVKVTEGSYVWLEAAAIRVNTTSAPPPAVDPYGISSGTTGGVTTPTQPPGKDIDPSAWVIPVHYDNNENGAAGWTRLRTITHGFRKCASNTCRHVTRSNGERIKDTMLWTSDHDGIDIGDGSTNKNHQIYSMKGGTVVAAYRDCTHHTSSDCGCNGGLGNTIRINHGDNTYALYAHLRSVSFANGASVSAGQQIGIMGTTGNSSGVHLHLTVFVGNTKVDPTLYFN